MNTQTIQTPLKLRGRFRTDPAAWGARLASAVTGPVSRIVGRLTAWQHRRAAIRELTRLSDRQLSDVGIDRERIGEVVDAMMRAAERRSRRGRA